MNMQYSKTGLDLTKQFEGRRLTAYQDSADIWTIANGITHYPDGSPVQAGDTCTDEQADEWLMLNIQTAVAVVNKYVTVDLTQGEFDACCDFVYNCGAGNFQHSTLLKLIDAGQFEQAASEFEKWDRAGGKVVAGLLRRRLAEEKEFTS